MALERLRVGPLGDLLHGGADGARRVLQGVAPAWMQRLLAHPAERAVELAGTRRLIAGRHQHIAAADVEAVRERERDRHRRHRRVRVAVERVELGDRGRHAGREHDHFVSDLERAGVDPAHVQP